jgi:6-hydroxycyclohex-1-ene-1-carbonyl-CoA dehydrogenase
VAERAGSELTGERWEMRAAGQPLERVRFALPVPGAGQALVRVAGCGVCHTDLGFLDDGVPTRAPLPLALGHEIAGEVLSAAAGFEHLVGRAVIVPAVTPCGACCDCLAGHASICQDQVMPGNDVQGGFATHVLVPARGLCVVDDPGALRGETVGRSGCTLAELAVVADALTTPYQALHRARVGPGDLVVVVGLGGVGGFAAQLAAALGAAVIGLDIDPRRLEQLAGVGLAAVLDARELDERSARRAVRDLARGQGSPERRWKIFECSGTPAGQRLAFGLLVHGAYLSIVGFTPRTVEVRLSNLMAFDAKAVGNWGCVPELYPAALALVLEGRVRVRPFVQTFPLDHIETVLEDVRSHRAAARPVLVPATWSLRGAPTPGDLL